MSVDAHIRSEVIEKTKEIQTADRLLQKIQEARQRLSEMDRKIQDHIRLFFCHTDDTVQPLLHCLPSRQILQSRLANRIRNQEPTDLWQETMSSLHRQRTCFQDQIDALERKHAMIGKNQSVINFACENTPFAMAEYDPVFADKIQKANEALFKSAMEAATDKKPQQEEQDRLAVNHATAAAIPLPPRKKQKRAKKIHKTNSDFVHQIEVSNKATVFHMYLQSIGKEAAKALPTILDHRVCRHCG